jgi:hypothetical protein
MSQLQKTIQSITSREWAGFEIECLGCTKLLSIFDLANYHEAAPVFCSDRCKTKHESREQAERRNAPMVKPQPKRVEGVNFINGWDV